MPAPDTLATITNDTHYAARLSAKQGAGEPLIDTIEMLMTAARPRLLRLAQVHGVQHDAADDVVQETLLEAWRNLDHLRDPARFDAWLNGICRNVCLRWSRAQGIATARQVPLSNLTGESEGEDAEVALPDSTTFDPVEELNRQDMTIMLDRALGYLPSSTREAVELCYLAELPQREAALRLGVTIHALEERLYRARRQLRQLLNNELRSEAESFGLLEPEEAGWQQTRIWCPYCGRRRQIGLLESRDGLGYLRTRCPSCSLIYGDVNTSSGLKVLYGLRSFKPALNRVSSYMQSFMPQALELGIYPCRACGKPALVRITEPGEPFRSVPHPHPHRSLVLECSACGEIGATWACSPAYWSHSEVRAFDAQHPQTIIGPEVELEYENRRAIRFCLIDIVSNEKLVVITDYYTLAVLAIFYE